MLVVSLIFCNALNYFFYQDGGALTRISAMGDKACHLVADFVSQEVFEHCGCDDDFDYSPMTRAMLANIKHALAE